MKALLFIPIAAFLGFLAGLVGPLCDAWAWKSEHETLVEVVLWTCYCALLGAALVAARILL